MTTRRIGLRATSLIMLLILSLVGTVGAVYAQIEIPAGATVYSATLTLYPWYAKGQTVNVHRVTAEWIETQVTWNSFGEAFDPAVEASLVPVAFILNTVDVTALVQGWIDGSYPNYGLLLEGQSDLASIAKYSSSEWPWLPSSPTLEICFAPGDCVTIQDGTQDDVADAYVSELDPDSNFGLLSNLQTGGVDGHEKQSLIRFNFGTVPPPPPPPCGEGCTPGYWKNHLDAWGPTGYSPSDDFDTVFGTEWFDPDVTLEQALNTGGGDVFRLGRHGTAALLSASHPDVGYGLPPEKVMALVSLGAEEDVDILEWNNELGCPLD